MEEDLSDSGVRQAQDVLPPEEPRVTRTMEVQIIPFKIMCAVCALGAVRLLESPLNSWVATEPELSTQTIVLLVIARLVFVAGFYKLFFQMGRAKGDRTRPFF